MVHPVAQEAALWSSAMIRPYWHTIKWGVIFIATIALLEIGNINVASYCV